MAPGSPWRWWLVGFGLWILAVPPAELEARQELGTDCELQDFRVLESRATEPGRRITWIGAPFLVCPDGLRIRSDSAVVYQETGRNHLIGRVLFETPERVLRSREADYFEGTRRLHARGEVEFEDLVRGTEIRGDTLVHLEAGDFRPEEQVDVWGGRPSAVLPRDDLPEGEVDPDPYRVTADRLRFTGDRFFWADDDVEVLREEMRAVADSLAFDREVGQLVLTGRARVESEDGDFEGGWIRMNLPGDVLQSVTIRERGRLATEDMNLRGEEIRIDLDDEEVQRIVAVDRPAPEGEEPRPRPRAVTEDFILDADSIDVRSPGEVLETVYAVGAARAETRRRGGEPLDPEAVGPEDLEALPDSPGELERRAAIPDRDYIEGNEIVATFVAVPAADPADDPDQVLEEVPPSRERSEYRLDTLVALGEARSLYRSPPDREEGEPEAPLDEWSVSYILADRISIFLLEGEVDRMEAEGRVRILHLDPRDRRAQRPQEGGEP